MTATIRVRVWGEIGDLLTVGESIHAELEGTETVCSKTAVQEISVLMRGVSGHRCVYIKHRYRSLTVRNVNHKYRQIRSEQNTGRL